MDVYQETYRFNETTPITLLPEDWALTVRSNPGLETYYFGVALAAMTNVHQFLDISQEAMALHAPSRDAGALSELYSFDAMPDLDALAEAQGVFPTTDPRDLATDDWPEDESVEDFIAAAMEGRYEEDERNV